MMSQLSSEIRKVADVSVRWGGGWVGDGLAGLRMTHGYSGQLEWVIREAWPSGELASDHRH